MFRLTSNAIDRDISYHNGYRKGQKDFAEKVKAEIKRMDYHMIDCDVLVSQEEVLDILDNIGKEVINEESPT